MNDVEAGVVCRFRYTDGQWYGGRVVAVQEGQAHVDFLTPTRDFMLREGASLPLPALQAWPRRTPLLTSLAPGTCLLACPRQVCTPPPLGPSILHLRRSALNVQQSKAPFYSVMV